MDRPKYSQSRIEQSSSDEGGRTDEFMLPGDNEKTGQDKYRDVVHNQADDDITDTSSGFDHIQREHGKKQDKQN